jgi:cytochrome P450
MVQEIEGSSGSRLFDIDLDIETRRYPQAMYKQLRQASENGRTQGSVLRREGSGVVVCSRADVDTVLRNPQIFSSDMPAADLKNVRPLIPLQIDPPAHKKFRKILDPQFAPQRVQLLENPMTRLVNELIDAFADEDEIDFVSRFSVPFPSRVLLTVVGLPFEELPTLIRLKNGIVRPHHVVGTRIGHPEASAYQQATAAAMYDYLNRVLDTPRPDEAPGLLHRLGDAEVEGEHLSREDIVDICFLFLIAGLDDVPAALECCFAHLAEHPERRRELVADPTIIPRVIEELLRWETPVPIIARVAAEATELGGCPIAAGELVSVVIASANTDEEELPDAEEVRWDRQVNRHLTFGGGIHRCVGSHLARMVLRVGLREWHARIPDYRVKPGVELAFLPGGVRTLETFPMVLGVSAS